VWPATTSPLPEPWHLLLYTDGLIEGRDGAGRWGSEGLLESVHRLLPAEDGCSLDALLRALVSEAERRNGGPLSDDLAILALSSAPR
jgi:serine phosphatase RsbU (regulator of sigma subunit)